MNIPRSSPIGEEMESSSTDTSPNIYQSSPNNEPLWKQKLREKDDARSASPIRTPSPSATLSSSLGQTQSGWRQRLMEKSNSRKPEISTADDKPTPLSLTFSMNEETTLQIPKIISLSEVVEDYDVPLSVLTTLEEQRQTNAKLAELRNKYTMSDRGYARPKAGSSGTKNFWQKKESPIEDDEKPKGPPPIRKMTMADD